jgi:hypothetical protein
MCKDFRRHVTILASLVMLGSGVASTQALPTATQRVNLAAFVAGSGLDAGFAGTKNLDITAGFDFNFFPIMRVDPALEVRGTGALSKGSTGSLREALVGPRLVRHFGRSVPYIDFLVGRGKIQYLNGGFVHDETLFISSITTVYSAGSGIDIALNHQVSIRTDCQYQSWSSPVVPSRSIHPKVVSIGVVYSFDFSRNPTR